MSLGMTVGQFFDLRGKSRRGDIGIEFEIEGRNLPRTIEGDYWQVTNDGSLRGEAYEYVARIPFSHKVVSDRVDQLKRHFIGSGIRIDDSPRTSVHVHINVQKFMLQEVYSAITAYMILEGLLIEYSGESRNGNNFCLAYSDSEYITMLLVDNLTRGNFLNVGSTDAIRYSALNLAALSKYGSLEFRSMRGVSCPKDFDEADIWARGVYNLCQYGKRVNNPQDVVMNFSATPLEEFVKSIVGEELGTRLFSKCTNIHKKLYDGLDNALNIAFAIDKWQNLEQKEEIAEDDDKEDELPTSEPTFAPGTIHYTDERFTVSAESQNRAREYILGTEVQREPQNPFAVNPFDLPLRTTETATTGSSSTTSQSAPQETRRIDLAKLADYFSIHLNESVTIGNIFNAKYLGRIGNYEYWQSEPSTTIIYRSELLINRYRGMVVNLEEVYEDMPQEQTPMYTLDGEEIEENEEPNHEELHRILVGRLTMVGSMNYGVFLTRQTRLLREEGNLAYYRGISGQYVNYLYQVDPTTQTVIVHRILD